MDKNQTKKEMEKLVLAQVVKEKLILKKKLLAEMKY
jgi:hypothetical protein